MAKPLVTFADPVEAIVDYLDACLDGRNEDYVQGVRWMVRWEWGTW